MESYSVDLQSKWTLLLSQGFKTKVWWRRSYEELQCATYLKVIEEYTDKCKGIQESDSKEYLIFRYIHEVWVGECNCGNTQDTEELACAYMEGNDDKFTELAKKLSLPVERTKTKLSNLRRALEVFFYEKPMCANEFSLDLIKDVHGVVMSNLLDNAGAFRKGNARPALSSFLYCLPEKIEGRLRSLLDLVHKNGAGLKERHEKLLFSAFFLSEFLLIHPFSNGNGRVARLLMSMLLKDVTVVPFTLSMSPHSRDVYLQCLEERLDGTPPRALSTFILTEARRFTWNMYYVFLL